MVLFKNYLKVWFGPERIGEERLSQAWFGYERIGMARTGLVLSFKGGSS